MDAQKIVIEELNKCKTQEEVVIKAVELNKKLKQAIIPDIEKNLDIMFYDAAIKRIEELKKKED